MVSYKALYLKEKEKYQALLNGSEKTGMACPLCLENNIASELIWHTLGELVCENEDCSFDKTIGDILSLYYWSKDIGDLENAKKIVEKEA